MYRPQTTAQAAVYYIERAIIWSHSLVEEAQTEATKTAKAIEEENAHVNILEQAFPLRYVVAWVIASLSRWVDERKLWQRPCSGLLVKHVLALNDTDSTSRYGGSDLFY